VTTSARGIASWSVITMVNVAAAAGAWLSNNAFFMASGSDAPNTIVGPSHTGQLMCGAMMIAVTVVARRGSAGARVVLAAVWVLCLAALTHRVVVDVATGEVRDVYCLIPVQRLSLNGFEGDIRALLAAERMHTLRIATPRGAITVWRGVPPARLTWSI